VKDNGGKTKDIGKNKCKKGFLKGSKRGIHGVNFVKF
jgi:hypothetical protein